MLYQLAIELVVESILLNYLCFIIILFYILLQNISSIISNEDNTNDILENAIDRELHLVRRVSDSLWFVKLRIKAGSIVKVPTTHLFDEETPKNPCHPYLLGATYPNVGRCSLRTHMGRRLGPIPISAGVLTLQRSRPLQRRPYSGQTSTLRRTRRRLRPLPLLLKSSR